MKRILVSAGLVAVGAVGLHADEYAPDFTAMNATKPWTVTGTLRGFYDDNFTTSPNGQKQGSAGFEFSPQFGLVMPLQQTELGLRYTYGLYYYQQRENQGANPIDQSHQVDLWIDHKFTERWEAKVEDVFISSQEPQLSSSPTSVPYRVEGNNIQNVGTISAHTEWSMLFSSDAAYQNLWVDYPGTESQGPGNPSYAALLNEIQHSGWLTLNYQYLPDLSFMAKYTITWDDYTKGEQIAQNQSHGAPVPGEFFYSNNRNALTHTFSVGAQYTATANLSVLAWAGVSYVDNYNLPSFSTQDSSSWQPSANIAVTYTYLPGDYVQVGFTQSESSSSVSDVSTDGSITLYQETSVLYATVNHQITPKLVGSLTGHYQYSTYVGGGSDGESQNWYTFGLNLAYTFNPWASVDAGYNFYYLTSSGPMFGYSRNIGYVSGSLSF